MTVDDDKNLKEEKLITEEKMTVGEREQSWLTKATYFFLELVKVAILAGITIGLVRYFLFKPFYVKGQSMEPTFEERDYLIIDEITYRFRSPQRGEVVVFRAPSGNGDYYLKRVIGLPGERIKIDDNKVVVYNAENPQGLVVQEYYLNEDTLGSLVQTLGSDEYFVMGDNRSASYDSRRFGPVSEKEIVGRAWFRGYPFSRLGKLSNPDYN